MSNTQPEDKIATEQWEREIADRRADVSRLAVDAADWQLRAIAAAAERDRLAEQVRTLRQVVDAAARLIDTEHELEETDSDSGNWKLAELERDHAWDALVDATHAAGRFVAALPDVPTQPLPKIMTWEGLPPDEVLVIAPPERKPHETDAEYLARFNAAKIVDVPTQPEERP